jgi:hypothetical protein
MLIAGVLGGILGGAGGLLQPTLFLAENGPAVTLAVYVAVGGVIGLVVSGGLSALRPRRGGEL